jgi:hypothetical protein
MFEGLAFRVASGVATALAQDNHYLRLCRIPFGQKHSLQFQIQLVE